MKTLSNVLSENEALFQQEALIVEVTELISSIMEENDITKAQLARKLKKSKAFVTQCLSGEQNLTLRTVADFFTALQYQAQFGAVPSSSNQTAKVVHRLYSVGGWAYEKMNLNQPTVSCGTAADGGMESELCDVA
ncbi:MAG TPA: hypothetical protein VM578_02350 [Candidatus Saccharimonadales bacterium]|nr:hypothetical protein [Candidatus Saccharimonadales bacterium]